MKKRAGSRVNRVGRIREEIRESPGDGGENRAQEVDLRHLAGRTVWGPTRKELEEAERKSAIVEEDFLKTLTCQGKMTQGLGGEVRVQRITQKQ